MAKYLRLNDYELEFLEEQAKELFMVFKSPNDVLREILDMQPKQKYKYVEKLRKIRVDDDVMSEMAEKAKQLNMKVQPVNFLLGKVIRDKKMSEIKYVSEKNIMDRKTSRRPGTR